MNSGFRLACTVMAVALAACAAGHDTTTNEPNDAVPPSDSSGGAPPAPPPSGPPADCSGSKIETCSAWNVRSHCVVTSSGPTWVDETCPAGCFAGKCSASACADECVPGDKCQLWDMNAKAFVPVDPQGKLHDRSRDYDRILRAIDMPDGEVMNARFTDATFAHVQRYDGYHDSAIWTGTALAAQAFRLLETGSPDAARQVDAMVRTLHLGFTISGDKGYLARVVLPSNTTTTLDVANRCADPEWHCNVTQVGKTYDWLGATSRDQYTGVMLGLYLAYLATTDDALKKIIRDDIVAVVTELITVRKSVPAAIQINNGITINKDLDLENVILVPSEMVDGRVYVTVDSSDPSGAHMAGLREFFPDYAVIAKQMLGFSIPIPRPSSAMMLGAIVQMGLLVTDGVPGMQALHDQILAYSIANSDEWLSVAAQWKFDANCGNGYFANHIGFIMAYAYAMLETTPAFAPRIRDQVFDGTMWSALKGHKNAYFAFLWGGTRTTPDPEIIAGAVAQLGQFSVGPRARVGRNVVSAPQYMPHDTTCTSPALCDTATLAVDVKDRVVDDFIWQRQPWQLVDGGDALEVYPGVDYLVAYWAGRHHGFLTDDRAGTCTRATP